MSPNVVQFQRGAPLTRSQAERFTLADPQIIMRWDQGTGRMVVDHLAVNLVDSHGMRLAAYKLTGPVGLEISQFECSWTNSPVTIAQVSSIGAVAQARAQTSQKGGGAAGNKSRSAKAGGGAGAN